MIFLLLLLGSVNGLNNENKIFNDTKGENATEEIIISELPGNFSTMIIDVALGLPAKFLVIVMGNSTDIDPEEDALLNKHLHRQGIATTNFHLNTELSKKAFYDKLKKAFELSIEVTNIIICAPTECEDILTELTVNSLIHRALIYMFYWGDRFVSERFKQIMDESMRVAAITYPRRGVFRIYYNQVKPDELHSLFLVNWWSGRLYKTPVLPPSKKIYDDFRGRNFAVPVLHSPPWYFVKSRNDSSIDVTGGRDDKLLALIANKLNFKYTYFDPPDHTQGSGISANATFKGVLGMLWRREVDFFLGDVSMTAERLQAVEFSFLTLADSGAFVTHAPRKLNEALALVRSFSPGVWPPVVMTTLLTGPLLWLVISAPALYRKRYRQTEDFFKLFDRCFWYTTTIFLQQTAGREPSSSHKGRFITAVVSLCATYVIGDMYSASLTSLLARPAREPAISTLGALEEAMKDRGYELVVESHSSSLAILQDGAGIYGRLARLARRQKVQRVRTVELGVKRILAKPGTAVLAGRETLFYDTRRFGAHNFHLSEKLYTRYSAIAMQIGCPFIENFNIVLLQLFEAGIITKMTSEEYEKLRSSDMDDDDNNYVNSTLKSPEDEEGEFYDEDAEATQASGSRSKKKKDQGDPSKRLEPISMRLLKGAFILLGIGQLIAVVTFGIEMWWHTDTWQRRRRRRFVMPRLMRDALRTVRRLRGRVTRRARVAARRAMEMSELSLEFIN